MRVVDVVVYTRSLMCIAKQMIDQDSDGLVDEKDLSKLLQQLG